MKHVLSEQQSSRFFFHIDACVLGFLRKGRRDEQNRRPEGHRYRREFGFHGCFWFTKCLLFMNGKIAITSLLPHPSASRHVTQRRLQPSFGVYTVRIVPTGHRFRTSLRLLREKIKNKCPISRRSAINNQMTDVLGNQCWSEPEPKGVMTSSFNGRIKNGSQPLQACGHPKAFGMNNLTKLVSKWFLPICPSKCWSWKKRRRHATFSHQGSGTSSASYPLKWCGGP